MAIKTIKGLHDQSIIVTTSNNTYNVSEDATVIGSGFTDPDTAIGAIYERHNAAPPPDNNSFNIDGRVVGYFKGIETFGSDDAINIGAHGEVSAYFAITVHGDQTAVTNRGNVTSVDGYGITCDGSDDVVVHNFGSVKAYWGIASESAYGTTVTNEADGRIYSSAYGVHLESAAGTSDTFINHGVVRAATGAVAFFGFDGNDTVVNDGVLRGIVMLGDGDDRIDTRGGTIIGSIIGGNGNDTLITDNAHHALVEDPSGGMDTVKSTVSYTLSENVELLYLLGKGDIDATGNDGADVLRGNAGDNRLTDTDGGDALSGGKGDDVMTGGAGNDTFFFATGGGHDTITDFTPTVDWVAVGGWLTMDSFTEVMNHAHDQDDGVLIKAGHDSLLIQGLSKAELTSGDFLFTI
jgi:Ca2+-binding RTX toxin-like protein